MFSLVSTMAWQNSFSWQNYATDKQVDSQVDCKTSWVHQASDFISGSSYYMVIFRELQDSEQFECKYELPLKKFHSNFNAKSK